MPYKASLPTLAVISALVMPLGASMAQTATEEESASMPAQSSLITEQDESHLLSSELIGADVLHPVTGKIGWLESLLFDEEQQIVGGVVSVGGFLGIGAKSVALSWDEFDVPQGESVVYINLTKSQLKSAPAFKDQAQIKAEQEAMRAREQMQPETTLPQKQPTEQLQ